MITIVPTGYKGRVRCTICGRRGGPSEYWVRQCRLGHPFPCPGCPKRFPSMQARGAHWPHCPGRRQEG